MYTATISLEESRYEQGLPLLSIHYISGNNNNEAEVNREIVQFNQLTSCAPVQEGDVSA